jgi:hypothetical protein
VERELELPEDLLGVGHSKSGFLGHPSRDEHWLRRDHQEFPYGDQARTGEFFTSYVGMTIWSLHSHHLATVTSRHANHEDL